ncbi:hypothetical protein DACRYDRAFT_104071 [Dacryopinax primogenitus]|uniref:Protein PBN1 n=1 Tax=Dacryopinax primogenitus (strain DJM 731) TaxID=1858805 RepID=M5G9U4_DACPD|nr:uncharacterized protein DACRYDRAFT_104071 [Dacryopinax primogenitus]EJU05584.1 hypothetical protein DACRYDRAFT_104071 [Dacryopinax primogenitus]
MDSATLLLSHIARDIHQEPAYNCSLPGQGFHRSLFLTPLSALLPPETERCILQALFFLPPSVFADPYELKQQADDHRLGKFMIFGVTDLEGPVSAVDPRGTVVLLNLDPSKEGGGSELPLHMRYPEPVEHNLLDMYGQVGFELPCPIVYWACESVDNNEETSPFDDLTPPFVSPYKSGTSFYFLPVQAPEGKQPGNPVIEVHVPAGDLSHLPAVEWGTTHVILLAFLYVAYSAWSVPPRPHSTAREKVE